MDRNRDDDLDQDPVLRSLGEDLARDDPRLAALLSGRHPHRIRAVHLGIALPVLAAFLVLPITTAVGVVAVVLALASLLVGGLAGSGPDGGPAPGTR